MKKSNWAGMDFKDWQDKLLSSGKSPGAQQQNKSTGTMNEILKEAKVRIPKTKKLK